MNDKIQFPIWQKFLLRHKFISRENWVLTLITVVVIMLTGWLTNYLVTAGCIAGGLAYILWSSDG